MRVVDNTLNFDVTAPGTFVAIDAGHTHPHPVSGMQGMLTIRGNTVASLVPQPPGSIGIRAIQIARSMNMIDDNSLTNWPVDIETRWDGDTGDRNFAARFLVRRNSMENHVSSNRAAQAVVVLEDNRRHNGNLYS